MYKRYILTTLCSKGGGIPLTVALATIYTRAARAYPSCARACVFSLSLPQDMRRGQIALLSSRADRLSGKRIAAAAAYGVAADVTDEYDGFGQI